MRHILVKVIALALLAMPLSAQSVDSLIAKYVLASGGTARIQALQTLRRTGKFTGNDGFEAVVVQENKRPNGDVSFYFLDTEYYVPIRINTQRMIRGAPQELETSLGDYKQVAGVYLPFFLETGLRGSQDRSKITYEKIEANVPLDDQRFL